MADRGGREGQQLDNYRLIRLLGQGTFGEVYLGEDIHRKTQVAVKVLHTRLTTEELHAFLNEARVFRLKHPHIVSVLDFGVEPTSHTPFLVMDYAPNGTLRRRHPKGTQVPLSAVVLYVRQIAAALQYAHDENLIHRDIKPENLLIGQQGEILVSDFGIAIISPGGQTSLLGTRGVGGTPYYMAPEQWRGKPRRASDQYALGITVYEWLSGMPPFEGNIPSLALQHASTPPPSLLSRAPTILPEVEQVVLTTLAKDPKQRFGSVRAFATALEQAAQMALLDPMVPPFGVLPGQPLQPPVVNDLSGRSSQPIQVDLPLSPSPQRDAPTIPPSQYPPFTGAVPSSDEPRPPRRGISRRTVAVGLVGLAVAGIAGSTWLVLSQGAFGFGSISTPTFGSHPSPNPVADQTANPVASSTPNAGADPTPNPTASVQTQVTYKIAVITGDVPGAGTDANVYISIFGNNGSSIGNLLTGPGNPFEKGQTDIFYLTLADLGNLKKITIYHDNTGVAPGWYLDQVLITNTQTSQIWTFTCNCWLAVDEGDGKISRDIPVDSTS